MGYNSQLVRTSELGSSAVTVAAGGIECYHVAHSSLGHARLGDHERSGMGRVEAPPASGATTRPGVCSFILTPILSVAVSGDVVQWTAITFKWLTVHLK